MGKKSKEYTGETENIVMSLPKNTVKLKVEATVLVGDKLKKMKTILSNEEIANARNDYLMLDPTDDMFAQYVLNPEFANFLEKGEADGKSFEEICDEWQSLHD